MYQHETQIRVRYSETDRMGYVYYGNYAQYYEIGRVELFRSLGFSYRELEDNGINMPVIDMRTKYIRPATYDEVLTIKTIVSSLPKLKICFRYEIYNGDDELINSGETNLAFVDKNRQKPIKAPGWFVDKLRESFE